MTDIDYGPYTCFGWRIPERMMGGIRRYIEKGIIPGDFLQAVIRDSLRGCIERADDENMRQLPAYVYFFYNKAPAYCWGSKEAMKKWHTSGGLEGQMAEWERTHPQEQESTNEDNI